MKSLLVTVFLVAFMTTISFAAPPEPLITNNPNCPEGSFHKLTGPSISDHDGVCYTLLKPEYGFEPSEFPTISDQKDIECSVSALKDAINTAPSSGRIINLPECTLTVSNTQIEIVNKNNIVIQGQGVENTNINATGRNDAFQALFKVDSSRNVIVRDLNIEGNNQEVIGVNIERSRNVLVERIKFRNGRIAVRFPFSRQITVRYIDSYFNTFHGVAAKDCGDTNQACPDRNGDFLVYSNSVGGGGKITQNTGNGIDLHSEEGEVAGNYSYKNGQGNKFPDARNIWVHNNVFEENTKDGWVVRTYSIYQDKVEHLYFFNNTFKNNGADFGYVIFPGPGQNFNNSFYLIDNYYLGSDSDIPNKISQPGLTFKVCNDTQDFDRTPESIREVVSGDICQIATNIQPIDDQQPTPEPTSPEASPTGSQCEGTESERANINKDPQDSVNILDFSQLINDFGTVTGDTQPYEDSDINCDNTVDILDFSILISNFGR